MKKYYICFVKKGSVYHDSFKNDPIYDPHKDIPSLVYIVEKNKVMGVHIYDNKCKHYILRDSCHNKYIDLKAEMDLNENYYLKEATEQEVFLILL